MNELYISINRTQEEIKEEFKKRTHIIAVHVSYSGPLRKNEFQYSFGGNEANNSTTGFLIPISGRIKMRLKVKLCLFVLDCPTHNLPPDSKNYIAFSRGKNIFIVCCQNIRKHARNPV